MMMNQRFSKATLWRVGSALWLVTCGASVLNWSRHALAPEQMNPAHGYRMAAVWLAVVVVAALWVGRRAACVPWITALALSALALYPLSLWPLALMTAFICSWAGFRFGARGWLLSVPLAFVASLVGAYERIFGHMSAESASTIFQTTPVESVNYVLSLVTPGLLFNWVLFSCSLWLFSRREEAVADIRRATGPAILASCLALLLAAPALLQRGLSIKQGWKLHEAYKHSVLPAEALTPRAARSSEVDIVWVIGESSSRWQWQLYGYPRATTPRLSAREGTLVVLRDAVAPHSYTVQSLLQSTYRQVAVNSLAVDLRNASVVDVLRSASVPVHWFSAQERFGPWSTPITTLAERANTAQFFKSPVRLWGSVARGSHPDHEAQLALLGVLSQPAVESRVLVHHMFAAHDPYCAHRPVGTAPVDPWSGVHPEGVFGAAADRSSELGCYEDAIRFTDEVLDNYVEAADKRTRATVLVFVPDHGEAPEEGTGHNADRPSARHLEIPALLFFNAAARQKLAAQHGALLSNVDKPFFGSWTFELLLDLLGVPADGLVLRANSPARSDYRPTARVIYADGRRWNYDAPGDGALDDVLSRTRHVLQRTHALDTPQLPIYAHRVNTLLKAQEAARYFDGVELDVVFDSGQNDFFVYHPPMRNTGLRLTQQLQALASKPGLRLWFDFKNSSPSTLAAGLARLDALDQIWKLRPRTLIEIPEDQAPDVFAGYVREGWSVSLNIDDSFATCNARHKGQLDCQTRAAALTKKAHAAGVRALSFDFALWPQVAQFVTPLKGALNFYSWRLGLSSSDMDLPQRLSEMPPVEGLIVTFPSHFSP